MKVVPIETAQEEVDKWLDHKKVSQGKREKQKPHIEVLVDAICDGTLTLNSDFSFSHLLKFPIGEGADAVKEIKYKPRISHGEVHVYLQKCKSDDAHGQVLAYIQALTKQPKELLTRLDSEDHAIAQGFAVFFI